ncbi:MAG: hypothetical protein U1E53_09800 [Dongiaceae bacterium]
MDEQELEVGLAMLLEEMEGEAVDGHELLMRLTTLLNQMRATNMAVPDDLVELEQRLAAEYTIPAESESAAKPS